MCQINKLYLSIKQQEMKFGQSYMKKG